MLNVVVRKVTARLYKVNYVVSMQLFSCEILFGARCLHLLTRVFQMRFHYTRVTEPRKRTGKNSKKCRTMYGKQTVIRSTSKNWPSDTVQKRRNDKTVLITPRTRFNGHGTANTRQCIPFACSSSGTMPLAYSASTQA
jgi:hypothetical protein